MASATQGDQRAQLRACEAGVAHMDCVKDSRGASLMSVKMCLGVEYFPTVISTSRYGR